MERIINNTRQSISLLNTSYLIISYIAAILVFSFGFRSLFGRDFLFSSKYFGFLCFVTVAHIIVARLIPAHVEINKDCLILVYLFNKKRRIPFLMIDDILFDTGNACLKKKQLFPKMLSIRVFDEVIKESCLRNRTGCEVRVQLKNGKRVFIGYMFIKDLKTIKEVYFDSKRRPDNSSQKDHAE